LEPTQFVARNHTAIGGRRVDSNVKLVEICDRLDRHDLFAAKVDQKVVGYAKYERLCGGRNLALGCFVRADINILPEIFDLARIWPLAAKITHEKRLQRQHFSDEPRIDFIHAEKLRAMRVCVFATGFGSVGHSPASINPSRVQVYDFEMCAERGRQCGIENICRRKNRGRQYSFKKPPFEWFT
jgi:hypothetical protein